MAGKSKALNRARRLGLQEWAKKAKGEPSLLDHELPRVKSKVKASSKPKAAKPTPAQKDGQAPTLWPDGDGLLVLPPDHPQKQRTGGGGGGCGRAKKPGYDADYQLYKMSDLVTFNFHSEKRFVMWLQDAIEHADMDCVSVSWAVQNGAFDLGLSLETMKRYVVKHTADRAEFRADGGFLFIRVP